MFKTTEQRLHDAKLQEKNVADHFEKFIKADEEAKNKIIKDLQERGKSFSQKDLNRIKIKYANINNKYAVDLSGWIDDECVFNVEAKTIEFDSEKPNRNKRPIVPITAETGTFIKNGLVNFYNNSCLNQIPLYFIVYDEHAFVNGTKTENFFYFYDATRTRFFVKVINMFFNITKKYGYDSKTIERATTALQNYFRSFNIFIPTPKNFQEQLFVKWNKNGAISFFPSNCGIHPDRTFS